MSAKLKSLESPNVLISLLGPNKQSKIQRYSINSDLKEKQEVIMFEKLESTNICLSKFRQLKFKMSAL